MDTLPAPNPILKVEFIDITYATFSAMFFSAMSRKASRAVAYKVRSGQVWGHTPEQRVAASTLQRYSLGLRLAIAQADARPVIHVSLI